MKINRKEVNANIERNMVIGLIVDHRFNQRAGKIIQTDLIQTQFVKVVSRWCMYYFNDYQEPIGSTIQNVFDSKRDELDDETVELIDEFLESISNEYERNNFNTDFALKETQEYFEKKSLLELSKDIKALVNQGKIEEAKKRRDNFKPIEIEFELPRSIFDPEVIREAFIKSEQDLLFKLQGPLGQLIGPFKRTDFIALSAPMKRGKSFILIDIATRAALKGNNVLFVTMEMPTNEINQRFYCNINAEYIPSQDNPPNQKIQLPYFTEDSEMELKEIHKKGLTIPRAEKKMIALRKQMRGDLETIQIPAQTINTDGLARFLETIRFYKNYVPDVLILDYIDLLAAEKNTSNFDFRNQTNVTWMKLRKLAQDFNLCLVSATQSSRANFKRDIQQDDISEDIRKLAHVTKMIGINAGSVDPKNYNHDMEFEYSRRYNVLAARHQSFNPDKMVRVLNNYTIGKAYLDSRWID